MVYKIGGAAQRQVNIQIFSVFQTQMEHTFLCLERNRPIHIWRWIYFLRAWRTKSRSAHALCLTRIKIGYESEQWLIHGRDFLSVSLLIRLCLS